MKFTNIFGNPPFQDNESRNKTQHKIWPIFTKKAIHDWLEDDGNLFWISPYSWGSPSSKILSIIKEYELSELNLDTDKYFPNVGSTFSHYRIIKRKNNLPTNITKSGNKFSMTLDDDVFYIPNDVCSESMSIHSKVMFGSEDVFDLHHDYVTCHNVIRHAKRLHERKIDNVKLSINSDVLSENLSEKSLQKKILRLRDLVAKRPSIEISLSETLTAEHTYPVFHTNNKVWYSSKRQTFADKKKVMWSRSGYVKPFFDDGVHGCTDMGYYILVATDEEGRRLVDFLSSDLMKYVFKTAKWSGFGNELVFSSIPNVDLSVDMTLDEYYKLFDITTAEQSYITTILNPKKVSRDKKSNAETKSEFRVKKHGEVYTPNELVQEMMDMLDDASWKSHDETFIDPACGNGNFLVNILARRLDSGVPPSVSVKTLYGIDIMQDNIDESIGRMCSVLSDRGHDPAKFIDSMRANIVLSNSLEHTMEEIFKN